MLVLYVKDNCRYSNRVLDAVAHTGLGDKIEIRNRKTPSVAQELFEKQGSYEVPYLIDTETAMIVDESDGIVKYLHDHAHT
jgi:hypothetical protein